MTLTLEPSEYLSRCDGCHKSIFPLHLEPTGRFVTSVTSAVAATGHGSLVGRRHLRRTADNGPERTGFSLNPVRGETASGVMGSLVLLLEADPTPRLKHTSKTWDHGRRSAFLTQRRLAFAVCTGSEIFPRGDPRPRCARFFQPVSVPAPGVRGTWMPAHQRPSGGVTLGESAV